MNFNPLQHAAPALARAALPVLVLAGLAGLPGPAAAQSEEEEIAHPFFTHEGLPDEVGSFSMRASGLSTRMDGKTKGDFALHLETGLSETIGLHIRSDEFLQSRRSEVMFQFVAWKSRDGKSGFAPIIEFEIPTRTGGGKPAVLVGFTSKFEKSRVAINQVVHYDPEEKSVEASASLVLQATPRIYPVIEFLGEGGTGLPTIVNVLTGVKYRLRGGSLLGLAYQRPLTSAREISSQIVLQFEFSSGM